jgi:integrase
MLTAVILDTGLRLSEAFTLRVDQLDLARRLIHVEGSKGHRGKVKPRTVPLKRHLLEQLTAYCEGRAGLLFPGLWDGTREDKRKAGHRLTQRFRTALDYAGLDQLVEHDLRHEATCRWFELRKPDGGWVFSEIEICKIMGWTDTKLALRYLSLRGEDLSNRLGEF